MMRKWITLDPNELNRSRREKIRGVDVEVFMSPFDVPEAVQGYFDESIRRFVIEFKYIGGREPLVEDEADSPITLKLGRHSRRLYRIEIDVDRMKVKQVDLRVYGSQLLMDTKKALDRLTQSPLRTPRMGNYRVAQEVVSSRGEELLQSLGST